MNSAMHVVILAGGSGTRFWPISRAALPKQLVSVTGGPTMLQRTIERVLPLKPKKVLVVTNRLQADETGRQLSGYEGQVDIEVVAEPVGRNTAPAIALAASIVAAEDAGAVMAVLPADHFIRNEDGLRQALLNAADIARLDGCLVTLGIVPVAPETGYGYIEADLSIESGGSYRVARFVEKPDTERALSYIQSGNYFWNSGMFVWRADMILQEISIHMPELADAVSSLPISSSKPQLDRAIEDMYASISSQSIDYGVMERSGKVRVIPVDIGWSDVGSWSAIKDIIAPDMDGNFVTNSTAHIAIDSSDCVVSGNGGVVATIGVNDLVVVSSGDCLLVCPRGRAQDVRQVVDELRARGLGKYL